VRDALERRLARLAQPCVALLEAAALAGPDVRPWLVDAVLPTPGGPGDLLDEARRARVLVTGPDGGLRFAHDLFRETLVAAVPAARRGELHLRIGRAQAQRHAAGAAVGVGEVAAQFVAAGTAVAAPEALRFSVAAAREATSRFGHEDACRHYEHGMRALDLLETPDDAERTAVLLELAAAADRAGDGADARERFREAAATARRADDAAGLARAAIGIHGLGARSGTVRGETIDLLTEAAAALPPDATALRVRVLAALAMQLRHGRVGYGWVIRARRRWPPPRRPSRWRGRPTTRPGWRRRCWPARRAVAARCRPGAARGAGRNARRRGADRRPRPRRPCPPAARRRPAGAGRPGGHRRAQRRRAARRGARPRPRAVPGDDPARVPGPPGRADGRGLGAGRRRSRARRAHRPSRRGGVFGTLQASLGFLSAIPDPSAADVFEADPIGPMLPVLRAWGLVAAGRRAEAQRELAGFATDLVADKHDLEFHALLAAATAAVGSAEQRAEAYRRLLPHAGLHVVIGGCASYSGAVDHHLGQLAAALGHPADAERHLRAATEAYERLGVPAWAERSRAALAELGPGAQPVPPRRRRVDARLRRRRRARA
jgi:hypothetical protein